MKIWVLRTPEGKVDGVGIMKYKAIHSTTSGMRLMNYIGTGLCRDAIARGWTVKREEWESVKEGADMKERETTAAETIMAEALAKIACGALPCCRDIPDPADEHAMDLWRARWVREARHWAADALDSVQKLIENKADE